MKTALSRTPDEQARKQLVQFGIAGLTLSLLGVFALAWLGIAGLAFGARALLLSFHAGNANRKYTISYRVMSLASIAVGLFDLFVLFVHNS